MSQWGDAWVIPWMTFLADWSLRWALILAPLTLWLVAKPPGRASTRHLLCLSALAAGLLLPFGPRWNVAAIPGRSSRPIDAPASPSANGPDVPAKPISLPSATAKGDVPSGPASPTRPTAAADPGRSTPWGKLAVLALVTAWTIAALVILARLAFGWRLLNRLRREAIEIDGSDTALLGECREALGVSRAVKIAVHPAVASPVVVGGFRPVVLVPPDWNDWPEPHRRACLLHELAHLARYDDWARLGQEPIRAAFWFHPLVHWLLNRLDRERELLCDEAAVGLGSDPVAYARLLLNLARRPVRLIPSVLSAPHGSLPFLDRRTVGLRIHRLLEETMPRRFTRGSRPRSILAGSLIAALAVGLGGPRLVPISAQPPPTAKQPPATQAEAKTETAKPLPQTPPARNDPQEGTIRDLTDAHPDLPRTPPARNDLQDLHGVVVDLDGQPIAGATVVAGTWRSPSQVLTTDAQGRFFCKLANDGTYSAELVAHKPGWAASIRTASRNGLEARLELDKTKTSTARLVDTNGAPMAGAKIRVRKLSRELRPNYHLGETFLFGTMIDSVPWEIIKDTPAASPFETTTGEDGSFTFHTSQQNIGLLFEITGPDGRPLQIMARTPSAEKEHGYQSERGLIAPIDDNHPELVVIPAARLKGRVVSKVSGVDMTSLSITYRADPMIGDAASLNDGTGGAKVDSEGRFQFDHLSDGTVTLSVEPREKMHKDWTFRPVRNVSLASGRTTEAEIELILGIQFVGTVVAKDTGRPLEGVEVSVRSPQDKPIAFPHVHTDAQGRYFFRLPYTDIAAQVTTVPDGYTHNRSETVFHVAATPDESPQVQIPPIELEPVPAIHGTMIDANGAPVAGAKIVGYPSKEGNGYFMEKLWRDSDAQGKFTLPTALNDMLTEDQSSQWVIRLADGTEQIVTVVPKDHEIVVKLAGKP